MHVCVCAYVYIHIHILFVNMMWKGRVKSSFTVEYYLKINKKKTSAAEICHRTHNWY